MTPDQAAWVRERVWPSIWLRGYNHIPGTFLDCACTGAPSCECQRDEHGDCRMDERGISHEGVIQTSGLRPASFPEPYTHRSPVLSGRNVLAWVWLARPCRWVCTCFCHRPDAYTPREAVLGDQLDLFAVAP